MSYLFNIMQSMGSSDTLRLLPSWTLFLSARDVIRHSHCYDISNKRDSGRSKISLAGIGALVAVTRFREKAPNRDQHNKVKRIAQLVQWKCLSCFKHILYLYYIYTYCVQCTLSLTIMRKLLFYDNT